MDIAAWLRSLGLERYELVFRDNEIDAAVLPELTDEHLKELGLPLGPRLKLLKAMAALRAGDQARRSGPSPIKAELCSTAGSRLRRARAKSSCSAASPASANPASSAALRERLAERVAYTPRSHYCSP